MEWERVGDTETEREKWSEGEWERESGRERAREKWSEREWEIQRQSERKRNRVRESGRGVQTKREKGQRGRHTETERGNGFEMLSNPNKGMFY